VIGALLLLSPYPQHQDFIFSFHGKPVTRPHSSTLEDYGVAAGSSITFNVIPKGRCLGGATPPSSPAPAVRTSNRTSHPPLRLVESPTVQEPLRSPSSARKSNSVCPPRRLQPALAVDTIVRQFHIDNLQGHAIQDESLARSLNDTPVTHHVAGRGAFDGIISGYRVLNEPLQAYILHKITFEDSTREPIEVPFDEALNLYERHLEEHLMDGSPLEICPRTTVMDHLPEVLGNPRVQLVAGQGTAVPLLLPIPSSLCDYPIQVSSQGKLLTGHIKKRAISSHGLHMWGVVATASDDLIWIDNDDLFHCVDRAKRLSKIKAPTKKHHLLRAIKGFTPEVTEGWNFDTGNFVGRAGSVHLTVATQPAGRLQGGSQIRTKRRNNATPVFTVIVEATFSPPGNLGPPTAFWARLQSDPTLSVILTSAQIAADALHAYDVAKQVGVRSRQRTFPRVSAAGSPLMDTLDSCLGDFQDFSAQTDSWKCSLQTFETLTSGEPFKDLGLGFVLDNRSVPGLAQPALRRALARVVSLVEDGHAMGWRLLEHFSGLILGIAKEEVDFGAVVRKRAALLLAGDWKTLIDGMVRRRPTHVSNPSVMGDPLDTLASRAQYHITRNGSISKASQTLRSPLDPVAPPRGTLTATMRKLHPQVGDPIPDPPFANLFGAQRGATQGGGDRPPIAPPPFLVHQTQQTNASTHLSRLRNSIASPGVRADTPTIPPISFTVQEVILRVRRGDNGVSGGLDGNDYRILKCWFSKNDLLAQALTRVLNMIAAGKVSPEGCCLINASRGVGVPKDELGDLRPVAVGHLLLRLIGSLALQKLAPDTHKFFVPAQFGVGVRSGSEIMINAISARLQLRQQEICISCDVKNAFNSFDRSKLWGPLRAHFPSLEHLVRLAYMEIGTVIFSEPGDDRPSQISSTVGSRQGCSLGSFLYCLAIHEDLLQLQRDFPDCHITAYCDDLTIVGPPARAILAYKKWSYIYSKNLQGELRDEKGKVYSRELSEPQLRSLGLPTEVMVSMDGIKVLGAPIGSSSFIYSFLEQKVIDLEHDMLVIERMTLHHAQHTLITKSVQHRMGYLLRCIPCGDRATFAPLAARYDKCILSVPQRICHHVRLTQRAVDIAYLPMYLGGLGYRRWLDLADPSYLASYFFMRKTLPTMFPDLGIAFPDPASVTVGIGIGTVSRDHRGGEAAAAFLRLRCSATTLLDTLNKEECSLHHLQKKLTEIVDQRHADALVTSLRRSTDVRAHQHLAYQLSSRADRHSLSATPVDSDTTLSNSTLLVAVSLRLLEPILPFYENEPSTQALDCPCCRKVGIYNEQTMLHTDIGHKLDIDHWGYHSIRCYVNGNAPRRTNHHDKLVIIWEKMLRHAGFQILHEPTGHLLLSDKRPDSIINDVDKIFLDVRTCDPLLHNMFKKCVDYPGSAAIKGEGDKDKKWNDLVESQGDTFIPLCHEIPGIIGEAALSLLDKASARFSSSLPQRNAFKAYWLTRLHVANIRGVAETIQLNLPLYAVDHSLHHRHGLFFHDHLSPFPAHFDQVPAPRPQATSLDLQGTQRLPVCPLRQPYNSTTNIFSNDSIAASRPILDAGVRAQN